MVSSRQQKRLQAQEKLIKHFDEKVPYFTEIFDERTFYISFACLCVVCIILAIFLSFYCQLTIKDADELSREREERKRQKKRRMAEKLLKRKLAKAGIDIAQLSESKRAKLEDLIDQLSRTETDNELDLGLVKDD